MEPQVSVFCQLLRSISLDSKTMYLFHSRFYRHFNLLFLDDEIFPQLKPKEKMLSSLPKNVIQIRALVSDITDHAPDHGMILVSCNKHYGILIFILILVINFQLIFHLQIATNYSIFRQKSIWAKHWCLTMSKYFISYYFDSHHRFFFHSVTCCYT